MFSKTKTCGACGQPFECGGLFLCWCREVKLDRAALNTLREQHDDCLCRSCLEARARGKSDTSEYDRRTSKVRPTYE